MAHERSGFADAIVHNGTTALASTQENVLCMNRDFEGVQKDNEKAVSEMKLLAESFEKEATEEGELKPSATPVQAACQPQHLACKLLLA